MISYSVVRLPPKILIVEVYMKTSIEMRCVIT